jgi:hypothetical protein
MASEHDERAIPAAAPILPEIICFCTISYIFLLPGAWALMGLADKLPPVAFLVVAGWAAWAVRMVLRCRSVWGRVLGGLGFLAATVSGISCVRVLML